MPGDLPVILLVRGAWSRRCRWFCVEGCLVVQIVLGTHVLHLDLSSEELSSQVDNPSAFQFILQCSQGISVLAEQ